MTDETEDEDLDEDVMTLSFFMDYITHDVEADEWEAEAAGMVVVTPDGRMDLLPLLMDDCLEDPSLSKWRNAFVWQLIAKHGDKAIVEISAFKTFEAIAETGNVIIDSWEQWDADASQAAQQAQTDDAYRDSLGSSISAELINLIEAVNGTSLQTA